MILRRFTKHLTDQNWFAVGLDVLVVITGIFLGMQVTEWNEERALYKTETELLNELKREIIGSIRVTELRRDSYLQLTEAGSRSLDFISSDAQCGTKCWPILVDLFHASQWLSVQVRRSTYENMRLMGLPRNRAIIDSVESYLLENKLNAEVLDERPYYRSIVRQLIPLEIQEFYWEHCYAYVDGAEIYSFDCPSNVSDDLVKQTVRAIVQRSDIKLHLTEWTGFTTTVPNSLDNQNIAARKAITLIDAELERRQ